MSHAEERHVVPWTARPCACCGRDIEQTSAELVVLRSEGVSLVHKTCQRVVELLELTQTVVAT